jgi:hypothetical protein
MAIIQVQIRKHIIEDVLLARKFRINIIKNSIEIKVGVTKA